MSPRDFAFRVEDILTSIKLIQEYTKDLNYKSWKNDQKTVDAVIRNFEIIGEASSHLPKSIQAQYTEIPWAQLRGMRNLLAHEYFGVDLAILWKTIREDLPTLQQQMITLYTNISK